jgi:ubiquinone/menaquinone biosynthesis C-methylase UbiE
VNVRAEPVPSSVAYFEEAADRYDRNYDQDNASGYALRTRLEAVCAALGDGPGAVLDAGMGGGRLCVELAARSWTPSGIDAAEGMVDLARARLPQHTHRMLVGRIEELPFADAEFDAVVATGSLEYGSVPCALAELARVLRPGGRAVLTYPNPYAFYALWKTRLYYPLVRVLKRMARRPHPGLPRGFGVIPPRRFAQLLRDSDFEVERISYTSYAPFLTPFDTLFPAAAATLARRLDRHAVTPALLSTQVVYTAHRRTA